MTDWQRTPQTVQADFQLVSMNAPLLDWLASRAQADDLLLAHALDGVIWGYYDDTGTMHTAKTSPAMRSATLQQIRVFNAQRELYVWRNANRTWQARIITDGAGTACDTFDEAHIVLGTSNHAPDDQGFTRMVQGAEGLVHSVPIAIDVDTIHPDQHPDTRLGLIVRHYLQAHPQSAMTTISASRFVSLEVLTYA
jgi:CRISPR-associated protein (TIGR03984 family)